VDDALAERHEPRSGDGWKYPMKSYEKVVISWVLHGKSPNSVLHGKSPNSADFS
jgi:hypothetical protein